MLIKVFQIQVFLFFIVSPTFCTSNVEKENGKYSVKFEPLKPKPKLTEETILKQEMTQRLAKILGLATPGEGVAGLGISNFGVPAANLAFLGVPNLSVPDIAGINPLLNLLSSEHLGNLPLVAGRPIGSHSRGWGDLRDFGDLRGWGDLDYPYYGGYYGSGYGGYYGQGYNYPSAFGGCRPVPYGRRRR